MSQFIRGTVTVWVDLGFKIEGGAGYANKVLGSGFLLTLALSYNKLSCY